MSRYTTGELAKLCGVTVRTVQYYDTRNILVPSEISEGGRRLYSEEDLRKLKVICFLRDMGLSIDAIRQFLLEEHPEAAIAILLEEQEKMLQGELAESQKKLAKVSELKEEVKKIPKFTVESIGDIAYTMENKRKWKRLIGKLILVGFIMDAIQVSTFVYGILKGVWWPFALGLSVAICMGIGIFYYYYRHVEYICPECHGIFQGSFREMFFARHTPRLRKMTCPHCSFRGFCVETYHEEKNHAEN